ncbi:uncharacterized protein LOC122368284 isoform X1 [Amphibalanus amphitrite]|uniref:uncharacterized protein LOC122368284 isoform X1 n=2 Tax=Amphibalanus amphitrite TaxID=1232801 RepID=UPI001C90F19D|nr:uncharacterized protein LOC122368284 isoform X1 [Amphibalanus amphitrite]
MLFSVLTVTVLAALMTVPGQVEAQRGRTQECVTPSGFLGSCRYGRCPSDGGPSPVCARGYSCCVQVTRSRPRGTNRRQGLGPTSFGRKTLLNPQFECGGEPAPEPMPDPSAIVFPRTKRQAPKPGAPTPAPGSGALFVAGGAPEPSTNAVGVGVISPQKPKRPKPSIGDILSRIRKPPASSAPIPHPPRSSSSSSSRRSRPSLFSRPRRPNNPRRGRFQGFFGPPRRSFIKRRGYGRPNYRRPRQNYYRRPKRYHGPSRNYCPVRGYHYHHPRRSYSRPRRGFFGHLLSAFSPSRRRYKRSPQTAEEAQAFESVWQEYQERVRAGDAPAGYTRQEILEAFRAASAEAALNPDPAPGTSGWTCGAVLISERFMLTAAHCLLGGRPQVVRLGDLNLTSTGDGAPQEYRVLEVISHPEYRHPHVYHDLALLRLDRTVQFSEFVRPFCLFDGRSSLVDKVSHVSGWGATEFGGGQSDVLMGGNVTIWSQSRCAEVYERQLTFKRQLPDGITPALLCAGGEEQDACQGDSGGPMTVLTERGTRLVGIVSAGIGCAAPGIPGLYANVAHHLDWIDGVVYGGQGA